MDRVLSRLFWNVMPAFAVVGALYFAIAGEDGLWARQRISDELASTERRLVDLNAENARLLREVDQLRGDDVTLRRAVAEELLLVPPGSTVVRFEP